MTIIPLYVILKNKQITERSTIMKKIIALLLAFTFIFTLSACGKTTEKENIVQPNEEETKAEIIETTEKQNPKYNSDKFNTDALYNTFVSFSDREKEIATNLYDKINGRIVDVKAVGEMIYFLTPSGLYGLHRAMLFAETLVLDVGNNVKIITVCRDTVTLSDKDGNLSIYTNLLGKEGTSETYEKFDIEEFVLNDGDIFVGFENSIIWDDVYIFTDIKTSGITAKIFTHTSPYEEDNRFDYCETKTFNFSEPLNSEIKEVVFSQDLNEADGFVLLENGDLYHFTTEISGIFGNRKFQICGDAVKNVKKVWNDRKTNIIFAEKEDGKIYEVKFVTDDNNKWSFAEVEVVLPDNIGPNDIQKFVQNSDYNNAVYFVLNNGDVYMVNNTNDYEKHELLSEYNRDGKLKNIVDIWGYPVAIMDDGNMYSIITE